MAKRSFQPKVRGSMPSMRGNRKTAFNPKKRPAPDLSRGVTGITNAHEGVMMDATDIVAITASRTTGVAPLGVFFETTMTGSEVNYPFHELLYIWDFGESDAGTWGYGNADYNTKNDARGPVAAHVYDEDGVGASHTATVTVYALDGATLSQIATDSVSITTTSKTTLDVADEVVVYYDSTQTGLGTNPWANATERDTAGAAISGVTLEADMAAGVRVFAFKSGDSFEIDTGFPNIIGVGPGIWETYDGATPATVWTDSLDRIIGLGGNSVMEDWRISGLKFENLLVATGSLTGECLRNQLYGLKNVTIINNEFGVCNESILIDGSQLNFVFLSDTGVEHHQNLFIHGNVFGEDTVAVRAPTVSNASRGRCIGASALGLSIQGNDCEAHGDGATVEEGTGHCVRMFHSEGLVVAHNRLANANDGLHELKLHCTEWAGGSNGFYPSSYGERWVVSDNDIVSGVNTQSVHISPQNGSGDERIRNVIFERNEISRPADLAGGLTTVIITAHDVTFRNNVIRWNVNADVNGNYTEVEILHQASVNGGDSTRRVRVINNTAYHDRIDVIATTAEWIQITASCNDCIVANNSYVTTNGSGAPNTLVEDLGAGSVVSNNSNYLVAQLATEPPTVPSHFALVAGAGMESAGAQVTGLLEDFALTGLTLANVNEGAFQNHP